MFPRLRKITRLLVCAALSIFLFSSYLYLVGDSGTSVQHGTIKLEGGGGGGGGGRQIRSGYVFKKQTVDRVDDPFSYPDSTPGNVFVQRARAVIQNPGFLKERQLLSLKIKNNYNYNNINNSGSNSNAVRNREPIPALRTSAPPVNPHNFKYIHNPSDLCSGKELSFLIYVHSSPANLKKRQAIRQSWGDLRILSLFNASLVFILGATPDIQLQSLVDMEFSAYRDIVQEDFLDSYRNLTYKGMTALKWTARYCLQVSFVLKTDDDILLDVVSVLNHLVTKILPARTGKGGGLVLCNLWTRMKAMRNPKSKWFLSKQEFPHDVFPPYCSGSSFLLSADLIPQMYRTALNSRFFWVDDYFITGALINSLGIKHVPFNQAYLLNYNVVEERLKKDTKEYLVFHIKKLSLFQRVWPLLTKRHAGMKNFLAASSLSYSGVDFKNSSFQNSSSLPNVEVSSSSSSSNRNVSSRSSSYSSNSRKSSSSNQKNSTSNKSSSTASSSNKLSRASSKSSTISSKIVIDGSSKSSNKVKSNNGGSNKSLSTWKNTGKESRTTRKLRGGKE